MSVSAQSHSEPTPSTAAFRDRSDARPEARPPAYPFRYGVPARGEVLSVLHRIHSFVDAETPAQIIDGRTGEPLDARAGFNPHADVAQGRLRLVCYEMGLTCAGMLAVADASGEARFRDYAFSRLRFMAEHAPFFEAVLKADPRLSRGDLAFYPLLRPETLDDAGALAAAMIKAQRAGLDAPVGPLIERFIDHIRTKQHRLSDGTLARNRPLPNTLWADDLFMGVPALAAYAEVAKDAGCLDDAVRQIVQFSAKMVDPATGLFAHGWIEGRQPHATFAWGRANGWALLATTELLSALPASHPARPAILELLKNHVRSLARFQSGHGLWRQLLDRQETYLESSASAMFIYGIARAVNERWLDPVAFGPVALAGWSALAERVNAEGQVEGTCVGSGLALDPVFYHFRPTSPFAAHGYGAVLLAGAEMLKLDVSAQVALNDGAIHFDQNLPGVQRPLE